MTNYWKEYTFPHTGWRLRKVIDVLDGTREHYENCNMCGKEEIRYVHIVNHSLIDHELRVGCVCAEKMTNDNQNPRQKENIIKNKSKRRKNWSKKNWKSSKNGNLYLQINNHWIVIFPDKFEGKYKVRIDQTIGRMLFNNIEDAKIAAFNGIEYFKERREW